MCKSECVTKKRASGGREGGGAYLGHGLPVGGVVLAGVDAIVPAALHHIQDRFHRNVELGGPADLQLARRLLQKHQLFPRLERDS